MAKRFALVLAAVVSLAAFPAVPALAIADLSVQPQFPSPVYVGDGPLEASLRIGNEIYGDNEGASITKITMVPSCRTYPGSFHCAMPQSGVFEMSPTATGSGGTCAGQSFNISPPDPQGLVTIISPTELVLEPATAGNPSFCLISFRIERVHRQFSTDPPEPEDYQQGVFAAVEGRSLASGVISSARGLDPVDVQPSNSKGAIEVSNQASPATLPAPGGDFRFTVDVKNVGTEPVTISELTDSVYGDLTNIAESTCGQLIGAELGPGAKSSPCSYQVRFTGAQGARQKNVVSAEAVDSAGLVVLDGHETEIRITGDGAPTRVTVSPGYVTKEVGTPHIYVATARDQNGMPLAGVEITHAYVAGAGDCQCVGWDVTDNTVNSKFMTSTIAWRPPTPLRYVWRMRAGSGRLPERV